jgi:hypothetical protein
MRSPRPHVEAGMLLLSYEVLRAGYCRQELWATPTRHVGQTTRSLRTVEHQQQQMATWDWLAGLAKKWDRPDGWLVGGV